MRIFITGGNGMIGTVFRRILAKKENFYIIAPSKDELDIRIIEDVRKEIMRNQPNIIIHLAAITNIELCEEYPLEAFRTNFLGTWNISQVCSEQNITLVLLSSDMVFDGTKGNSYIETDRTSAINVYGKTKVAAEEIIKNLVKQFYIIRSSWLFGGEERDHKFVGQIINNVRLGLKIEAVNDRISNPTYLKDFCLKMLEIIENRFPWGTYHIVNEGSCTRHEYACKIIEFSQMEGVSIHSISSSDKPYEARRPVMSPLKNYHLELMGKNDMRPWEEALKEYIMEIWK